MNRTDAKTRSQPTDCVSNLKPNNTKASKQAQTTSPHNMPMALKLAPKRYKPVLPANF